MRVLFNKSFDRPVIRFLRYLIQQFIANKGVLNAAALTYTTLFAVVPLMTVSYAVLAAVPSFQGVGEQLQGWIFSNFVPATGAVVQDYLSNFAGQARNLTAVGVALLAVTAIMMMKNIEAAFNRVWRVSEPRKGLSSFLLYWAVLSLGPVLIGLGLVVTSYIASISVISSATELVGKARLLSILPMLLSGAAFTLLYAAVPNCRVPLKNALYGGFVVAVLFETAKRGFALFVTQFPSYELIYGAFAAVPLFLVWIFISWIIILLGAELTRGLTVYRRLDASGEASDLHILVAIIHRLWQSQSKGEALSDRVLLKEVPGLDQGRWDQYVQLLLEGQVISCTDRGHYLLCRDLGQFSINSLHELLPWPLPDAPEAEAEQCWEQQLNQRLQTISTSRKDALSISLEQLFTQKEKSTPSCF
ncbi:MAG: virulence factor BrkB family protein [Pontibacterium sp.]